MLRLRPLPALLAVLIAGCSSRPESTPHPQPRAQAPQAPRDEPAPPAEEAGEHTEAEEPTPLATLRRAVRTPSLMEPALAQGELPLRLPAPPQPPRVSDPRLANLRAKVAKYKLFSALRELQKIHAAAGDYATAAKLCRQESELYAAKGLRDASIIAAQNAARYDPATSLFLERAPTQAEVTALYSGAPNEPFVGCYIGAFIDRDDALRETYMDENWQTHRTPEEWRALTGKAHGSLFMYMAYGNKFPARWIADLKAHGVIPHIALEPKNLNQVKDDAWLRNFAQQCAAFDWPIMIRFASEMNGKWTPYHGNPPLYRQKFKLFHRTVHRYAPRVATIWCVNNPPLGNAFDYYPGDDGCDWVGVNFYAVPFHENKRDRPGFDENPLALLDPIYKKYAVRKPIAICEFAASHRSVVDNVTRNDFAIQKMSVVYGALPRLYPRVKMINWFSMDTIARPSPGKTLNDYTLSQQPQVLAAYRRETAPPYFLSRSQRLSDPKPFLPRPLLANTRLRGSARLSAWCNLQLTGTKVYALLGGKVVYASARPGAHEIALDLLRGPFGRQKFEVLVYDAKNRFAGGASRTVEILQ